MTKNGEKPRTLYGLFFHQLTAHLVSDLKHYGACDGERLELDERFLGPELEALLRQIPEYLELGEGTWYSVTKREQSDVLIFHVGSSDPDHARATSSIASVRQAPRHRQASGPKC